MTFQNILLFADRLPPLIGGMEVHANYFIKYFIDHPKFPLAGIITKDETGQDLLLTKQGKNPIDLRNLSQLTEPEFVFFNSGRWIEEIVHIRKSLSKAKFLYRTGGNEILKAPLIHKKILDHSKRQLYWTEILNNTIDLLITNSDYTEKRLRKLGITCAFAKCVGGVNISALKVIKKKSCNPLTFFCAARFVPYKNHSLLLDVIRNLILRGHNIRIRLAGDGPLLPQIKNQVLRDNLDSIVEFLGVLDNEAICQEIAHANIYIQFSSDHLTDVPGGSYIHSEGMGRSILEALTAGTFLIAGRSGALPEIVINNRGVLIDLNNIDQITNEVEQILKRFPVNLTFLNDFCWSNIFKSYEKLLEMLGENINGHRKVWTN